MATVSVNVGTRDEITAWRRVWDDGAANSDLLFVQLGTAQVVLAPAQALVLRDVLNETLGEDAGQMVCPRRPACTTEADQ